MTNRTASPGPASASQLAVEPSPEVIEARFAAHVAGRHDLGTRAWRSGRTMAIVLPVMVLNALLPALPGGAALAGVPLAASAAVYGVHILLFVAAAAVMARTSPVARPYALVNRMESAVWLVGSGVLIGLSGTARSIYWLHLALVVVLAFPMVASHRGLGRQLAVGCGAAVVLVGVTGSVADVVFAGLIGATLLLFHRLTMRVAPRSVRLQARAELLAERASEILVRAEQARIRRELHDSLGAELTGLLWTAQSLDIHDDRMVDDLVGRVREGLAELRVAMHAVAPEPMPPERLVSELRRILMKLSTENSEIVVEQVPSDGRPAQVPGPVCVAVLRAARECVRNAIHHGAARRVHVTVHAGSGLVVEIGDDGDGDPTNLVPGDGMRSVGVRLADVGGRADWLPNEPRGVRVRLEADVGG